MRVPRNLLPFVLPEAINNSVRSTSSHTKDEMDVAHCLVNNLNTVQTDSKLISSFIAQNVTKIYTSVMFPWGEVTSEGNTCPIDNWLMIFRVLIT